MTRFEKFAIAIITFVLLLAYIYLKYSVVRFASGPEIKTQNCDYLICPKNMTCPSVAYPAKKYIKGQCKCVCSLPDYNLPKPPQENEITFQGNRYTKTSEKYNEYIPDTYKIKIGGDAYIFYYNDTVYSLYTTDPHHGFYTYFIWKRK